MLSYQKQPSRISPERNMVSTHFIVAENEYAGKLLKRQSVARRLTVSDALCVARRRCEG